MSKRDSDAYARRHGLPTVDMSRFHVTNVRLEWRAAERDAHELRIVMDVPDIRDGSPTTVNMRNVIRLEEVRVTSRAYVVGFIYNVVLEALRHELDECLLVDGVQQRDPHNKGVRS